MTDEEFSAFMSPERVAERDRALTELVRITEEFDGYPELRAQDEVEMSKSKQERATIAEGEQEWRDNDPGLKLPPHANAEVHGRIMADLQVMTREEFRQSLVDAGIVTPAGELTEHYRDDESKLADMAPSLALMRADPLTFDDWIGATYSAHFETHADRWRSDAIGVHEHHMLLLADKDPERLA